MREQCVLSSQSISTLFKTVLTLLSIVGDTGADFLFSWQFKALANYAALAVDAYGRSNSQPESSIAFSLSRGLY